MIVSFVLVIAFNVNYFLWLFIPFASLLMFYCAAKLTVEKENLFKRAVIWVGTNSAFIFVSHPIARSLIQHLPWAINIVAIVLIYVIVTLVVSIGYRILNKKLLSIAN